MNDHNYTEKSSGPTETRISIQDIIQIRAILGGDQSDTKYTKEILENLDSIILTFTQSLSNTKAN